MEDKKINTYVVPPLHELKQAVPCLLCNHTLELALNESVSFPYVCQDCKDAIAYAKELLRHRGAKLLDD